MKKQATYTKEFKIQACRLVTEAGLKYSAVAAQMGINPTMLYRWAEEYRAQGQDAFVGKGKPKPEDAELRRLRRENERLRQENEILKKAKAYFAKRQEK